MWDVSEEDQRFKFPNKANKKIKFKNDSGNKILLDFYQEKDDFSDSLIHDRIEVVKDSIKKSKMKPMIIKQSNIPSKIR